MIQSIISNQWSVWADTLIIDVPHQNLVQISTKSCCNSSQPQKTVWDSKCWTTLPSPPVTATKSFTGPGYQFVQRTKKIIPKLLGTAGTTDRQCKLRSKPTIPIMVTTKTHWVDSIRQSSLHRPGRTPQVATKPRTCNYLNKRQRIMPLFYLTNRPHI